MNTKKENTDNKMESFTTIELMNEVERQVDELIRQVKILKAEILLTGSNC